VRIESLQTKPQPQSFDFEDCIQRFNDIVECKTSVGNYPKRVKFNWRKLKLEKAISQEEAKFWLLAMIETCQFFNVHPYCEIINQPSVDKIILQVDKWRTTDFKSITFTSEEIITKLVAAKGYYHQDTGRIADICLITLFPVAEILEFTTLFEQSQNLKLRSIVHSNITEQQLQDYINAFSLVKKKIARGQSTGFIWNKFYYDAQQRLKSIFKNIIEEYKNYFVIYQTEDEIAKVKIFIRSCLNKLLDFDFGYIFHPIYSLITKLNMIEELVESWNPDIFHNDKYSNYIESSPFEEFSF